MNRNFAFAILSSSIAIAAACSGDKGGGAVVEDTLTAAEARKHEHESDITRTEAGRPEFTVNEVFQEQIANTLASYLELKNALQGGDPDATSDAAHNTVAALNKVDMNLVAGAAHNDWMIYHGEMSRPLQGITRSTSIDEQRNLFAKLSYSLYKAIKAFGLGGETAYYFHCPTLFSGKGASWLSKSSEVANPYTGEDSSGCGTVTDTLH